MISAQAAIRAQQRGIPPLIRDWLFQFGEEQYDGHGAIRRFFSQRSIRKMERCFGCTPLSRLSDFFDIYLDESSSDGAVITIGHSYRRIRRRREENARTPQPFSVRSK